MHIRSKLAIAALAATALMALAVSSASARRIATTEQNFLASWSAGSPLNFEAAGNNIRCPVTLDGSFHSRTLSKVCGQLVGYINQAIVANSACTNGHATALTETLPWHIRYFRFSGTLPIITLISIQLIGARFQIETAGGTKCLPTTSAEHPAVGNINVTQEELGALKATELVALPEFTIPLSGGFACSLAGSGRFSGGGSVASSEAGRRLILVTLVQ
jgi:hypothetical protein